MDSYEFNKIAGAILATVLLLMGMQTLAGMIYAPNKLDKLAYSVEIDETADTSGGQTDAPAEVSILELIKTADADKGAVVMKKCAQCHTWDKGGANKIGPNLYGVLGRQMATVDGFGYSPAMLAKAEEVGPWTYEAMNAFLVSPKKYMKGTKMVFPGLKKDSQRANLLLYLNGQSDSPLPAPEG